MFTAQYSGALGAVRLRSRGAWRCAPSRTGRSDQLWRRTFPLTAFLILTGIPLAAHSAQAQAVPAVADSVSATDTAVDDEGVRLGVQGGFASGALHYKEGRSEQALSVVVRWAPTRWFSLSATPSGSRVQEPASSSLPSVRSGLTDLPIEANVTHAFAATYKPTVSGTLGLSLPVGDTAGGFGAGRMGSSIGVGLGLAPTDGIWTHLGIGRTISGFSARSAFSSADGWADASGGISVNDRYSLSAGYSTDFGAYDPTIGRSMSVSGGMEAVVTGATTLHVIASHGLSGAAPTWGFSLALGTAFPDLGHVGGSAMSQLSQAFGGGTHGLPSGTGSAVLHGRH